MKRPQSVLAPYSHYPSEPGSSFWISLRFFALTRLVVSGLLLGAVLISGDASGLGQTDPSLFLRTAISYVVFGAVFAYFAQTRHVRFYAQLSAQLVLDLAALTLMLHSSEGTRGGLTVLYLLPVAGAAILSPRLLAAGFAALSAIAILGETVWRGLAGEFVSGGLMQAGLYGIACFALALVINLLAARLIAQERIAQRRGRDLQRQIEINRLVVADMQDGVLILSEDGNPSAMNPAAARMLRIAEPNLLVQNGWGQHPAGRLIYERFRTWIKHQGPSDENFEISIGEDDRGEVKGSLERLRARFVSPQQGQPSGEHLLFLEDLLRVDERAQQLKLASMGRLTASIAHEIRNPLAAIGHAGALLAEAMSSGPEKRLLHIIQDNTRRLDRIVENILQLSRRGPVQSDDIDLGPFIETIVAELARDHGLDTRMLDVSIYGRPVLQFNTDHMRQVLVNLLQNARRHASGRPGSVNLVVVPVVPSVARATDEKVFGAARDIERIELIVQDDGGGIDSETRQHLFEPFFTTHHQGTGLGLYLARELCLANGATLGYVPNADPTKKGGFVVNAAGRLRHFPEADAA